MAGCMFSAPKFRLIDLAKPFLAFVPEIELPYDNLPFDDKIVFTLTTALIYLFGQFPLAAIAKGSVSVKDPIFFLRGVFAAEPRTLLEFGIFPPIATALILQLLAGFKLIKVNFSQRKDRELFQTLIKIVSIATYAVLANIFIASGYYGEDLSLVAKLLINAQLIGAGFFVTLLIEVIDKGHGFASGAMAIVAISLSTGLVDDLFGIQQIPIDQDGNKEPRGAIINLIQGFRAKHKTLLGAIVNAFQRDYLPNLTTGLLVVVLGGVVCYLQNVRNELSIKSTKVRGMVNVYPIRLLYTGGLSILFSYCVLFYVHILGFVVIQLIGGNKEGSIINTLMGGYESTEFFYLARFPLSLLTPPTSFFALLQQPLTLFTFTAFLIITGVWFATNWQEISGSSSRDVAKQFKEQGVTLAHHREESKDLIKIIPVASATGAAALAVLVAAGELLGLKGKGAGIAVAISSAFAILEVVTVDFQQNGGQSSIAQMLGGRPA
ncbi:unnamed protein product [Kluyveromyces dobzhanskii CBS 2104]|uniref:WGS project CCBQ000000000 data, contig 00272 n=1 Tax=Kluyveromyces dobzhanskii CBS 2104 TaxID=1427455 RepID=A0A0A8LB26_9SACH|nr:unnamed protein product [Kluyveromyces dobzhanskii CBS 2104]